MRKSLKQNNAPAQRSQNAALKKVRKSVYLQAGLALMTVILTIVILFAMTSAWYTNVVHSDGLEFEAAPWGFDGNIEVGSATVTAAPGDEGVVSLSVTNNSEDISSISVNVSKAAMDANMQQRIYFYVDAQQTRNGETLDRIYLSNQESYSYTLFSYNSLILTEEYHNDAQLKWQWVYDVLGYYVLGTVGTDGATMSVHEYLRPIEYDYDQATTTYTYVENGEGEPQLVMELKTVDGKTTVDDFLVKFSQRDGYAGTIDPASKNEAGYYPVSVDAEGYGVWAYLCSYSEIEMNTRYDTALGAAAAAGQTQTYTGRLTISAQKSKADIQLVSTPAALQDALASGTESVIRLDSDIAMTDSLVVAQGQKVSMDLNGHTLASTNNIAIDAASGSSVTVFNGAITGQTDSGYGILSTGAEVTLNNVDLSQMKYGVYVMDSSDANHLDSKVRLVDCTMDTSNCAVYVLGNGDNSSQNTQVVIDGCTITSGYNAVCGNGTATGTGKWGTDVQILNSTVTGKWSAVYQPQQNSVTTIYNSTLSGHTGIAIKGGTVNIIDSTVSGTGEAETPEYAASGFSDTGDAVYIETGYNFEILLNISGTSVLESAYGQSLQIFEATADSYSVEISGGTFAQEQPAEFLAKGSVQKQSGDRFVVTAE